MPEQKKYTYVAGFEGKQIDFEAESLFAAKQHALAVFKPTKKKVGYVWVVLAAVNDEAVVHVAVD